jgi:hypothetical protein
MLFAAFLFQPKDLMKVTVVELHPSLRPSRKPATKLAAKGSMEITPISLEDAKPA